MIFIVYDYEILGFRIFKFIYVKENGNDLLGVIVNGFFYVVVFIMLFL